MVSWYAVALRRSSRGKWALSLLSELTRLQPQLGYRITGISCSDFLEDLPEEQHVFSIEADEGQVGELGRQLGEHVWIEPEILHSPQPRLHVHVASDPGGHPLQNATIDVQLNGGAAGASIPTVFTNHIGQGIVNVGRGRVVSTLVVGPTWGHWQVLYPKPKNRVNVRCPSLTFPHSGLDWWHTRLGIGTNIRPGDGGKGIRIGVIDTGCSPHPALQTVQHVGVFTDNTGYNPKQQFSRGIHGTHVCGIINARPTSAGTGYWGTAAGSTIFSACVSMDAYETNQKVVARAVRTLTRRYQLDLINLSIASKTRSNIVLEAILDAADEGALCICAAGNTAGAVMWPAKSADAIGVSAVGQTGSCPPSSLSAGQIYAAGQGALAFATFSCYGQDLDCCGPGVGIVSTVPGDNSQSDCWLPLDGTSMASPAVCGALATHLSSDKNYSSMGRNRARVGMARNVLQQMCKPTGLTVDMEGWGMPSCN